MSEVILVASGKGGVGKTVLTANIGAILAQRGASVVLIDLNLGRRNLDICLGMENRIVYDLADAVTGICRIKQSLVKDRRFPALFLISAPQNRKKSFVSDQEMSSLCSELKRSFDYIIMDAPAGIDDIVTSAALTADRAVIVTVPEYAAIRDTDMLDELLRECGVEKRSVVINKVMAGLFNKGVVPDPSEIAESLRLPISGLIPFDENIHVSANTGVPIVLAKGSYIEKNLSNIVDRILKNL